MSKIEDILEERGNTHGTYKSIVIARANMLDVLISVHAVRYGKEPDTKLLVMWQDIILKLVRSAANPGHQDNWDDLAGYANIIQEVMEEQNATRN